MNAFIDITLDIALTDVLIGTIVIFAVISLGFFLMAIRDWWREFKNRRR